MPRSDVVHASDAVWPDPDLPHVPNTNLARQLGARWVSMRLWRISPGESLDLHAHVNEEEISVLLEGRGLVRVDGDDVRLHEPLAAVRVDPAAFRQVESSVEEASLWLIVGACGDLDDDVVLP